MQSKYSDIMRACEDEQGVKRAINFCSIVLIVNSPEPAERVYHDQATPVDDLPLDVGDAAGPRQARLQRQYVKRRGR